ncbi:hypothetical protein ACEZCY_24720 [Streptacidiphilus sp. N1-12]|uniref:Uncharacterized protein n=2 Tax=Streptacidiphilus alkalitolerans TaxID=3342712 RepID=A0ABV6V8I1_9ACTN
MNQKRRTAGVLAGAVAVLLALGGVIHVVDAYKHSGAPPPSCTTRSEPNVDCITAINTWCQEHDSKPADDCVDQLTLNYLDS